VRSFSVINQKGGCGKTTTSINLAAALAQLDQRVLLVDLDPQSHCALGLAVPENQIDLHIGHALLNPEFDDSSGDLIWQISSTLDLAPSTVALAGVERKLAGEPDRDLRLAKLLRRLADRYDICIIDCPPSIGLLTFNALRAADEVIIPVETSYFALKGARKQLATIKVMAEQCGHAVHTHVLAKHVRRAAPHGARTDGRAEQTVRQGGHPRAGSTSTPS
jgi:chromosome partitioning protein